jgi:L-amino acid N-acyltransferase YncA
MIELRSATPADAASIAGIYAPYVVTSIISFETEPPTPREMKARMASADDKYPWIVAVDEESKYILGYAYAGAFRARNAYRYTVETSVYVTGDQQRNGVGRLLYTALIATLREQNFTQAIGAIALPNDPSIALHESVGFRRAGVYREVGYKNGQWVDVGLWQCELSEAGNPPDDLKPFSLVGVVRS